MSKKIILILIIILVAVVALYLWAKMPAENNENLIGGDRDSGGCLIGAGYAFSDEVGACIREFEMTRDIKQAAKLAVDYAGREYGLTVVSFNSYEEFGAYDIFLQTNLMDVQRKTIYIRDGKASDVISGWERIKQAIENCEVESVFQAHSLAVSAELKSGEKLSGIEPKIDDIIDMAVSAEAKCGKIQMGTE